MLYTVPAKILWDVPKAVRQYEDVHGSCTFTGNPVPSSDLIYIQHCKYHYNVTVIGQYTVRVNFTINNATKRCQIYCYSASYPETRTIHITDTAVNSDNASYIPMNESTSTLMPTPTITILQESSTQSLTHVTSPLNIQPTITIRISPERQIITGVNNNNDNDNTGMIIALLLLVVILLIIAVLNLMFTIKNWKRKC